MLAKQLEYLGGAQGAGIVMGARVPIVLTSRVDDAMTRDEISRGITQRSLERFP